MTDLQILRSTLEDLTEAVSNAFQTPSLPAFILLYASIDILSSLGRPMNQRGTNKEVFKDWVTTYMIAAKTFDWNANDVYGARCGILHTYSTESDLSKQGKARPLCFISNTDDKFFFVGQKNVSPKSQIRVELDEFLKAFSDGVQHFEAAMQHDAVLTNMVLHHSKSLAFHVTMSFESSQSTRQS
jgi:hypothetical protein